MGEARKRTEWTVLAQFFWVEKVCDYFGYMGNMVHLVQMVVPDCTGSAFVLEFSWFLTHVNIYVIIL